MGWCDDPNNIGIWVKKDNLEYKIKIMAFKMNGNPAGNIQKLKIHGKSELFKKSGPPGFFSKLMDPLGLRKKIGGKLCGSKLFNPGGAGGPAAAAQAAAPAAAPAAVDPGAAAGIPAPAAAAPVEEAAAGPAVMREKNKLTGKPGAPWRFMTEEEEFWLLTKKTSPNMPKKLLGCVMV